MSDFNVGIEFDRASLAKMQVVLNPKRPEYNDFIPFWKGEKLQDIVGGNFSKMFKTWDWGKWGSDNVETGRMRAAMSRQIHGGKYSAGFPDVDALRRYNKKSLTWGLNLGAPGFQTKGGTYPQYPILGTDKQGAKPIAHIESEYLDKIPVELGKYIINRIREMGGR